MTSRGPTSSEPTGAPSPFEMQNMTVSACRAISATGTPRATAALKIRAPSMCTARSFPRATLTHVLEVSQRHDPAGVRLFDDQQRRPRIVRVSRRMDAGGNVRWLQPPAHVRNRPRGDARQSRGPARLGDVRVRALTAHQLIARLGVRHDRQQVAHRAAGTNSPLSLPSRFAARASSSLIVGSSPYTSSPNSAACIAARISGEGRVTVSLRRSMGIGVTSNYMRVGGRKSMPS